MGAAAKKQRETENAVFTSRGHGDKRPQKEHAAIIALLTNSNIPQAAKAANISDTTLWRWLQQDDFREKLREAQSRIFDDALGKLQSATTRAVECLMKNLDSPNAWASVQSARAIIHYGLKSREKFDLEQRLAKIESALEAKRVAEQNQRLFGEDDD